MLQPNTSGTTVTVILQPRHASFQTKTLELRDNTRIRIGRQTSSKTAPGPFNGYFDSKVLSRTHAEIWNDHGKVFIKDVKSSNGTFVNGQRLSDENEESGPMELKMSDQLEFGIDISQEDGSILYHKVSCQVYIIPTTLSQVDSSTLKELSAGLPNGNSTNKVKRKSSISSITSTIVASDGMSSPPPSVSNKWTTRSWDLLISKLQQEIQKSKEVENQLVSIKNAVSDANATLNDDQLAKADAQIAELQQKLEDTQGQLGSYKEKSRQQGQAIASASQELRRLQKTIRDLEEMNMHVKNNSNQSNEDATAEQESEVERWKTIAEEQRISLTKNLMEEKERSLAYESRCLVLEKRISQLQVEQDHVNKGQPTIEAIVQTRSVQLLLAIIIGLISTLIYVFAAV